MFASDAGRCSALRPADYDALTVASSADAAVNLYSDTQTRPSEGMRRAIAAAEVGDEQRGLDPTVNALQERVAGLLGHEAALFLPSGTMCNVIALRLHIARRRRRDLPARMAHPVVAEAGGPAALAGAMICAAGRRGRDVHGGATWRRRCATRATATSRARGWSRSSRRPTWAAGGSGRGRRSRRCSRWPAARPAHPPRRRPAAERGRSPRARTRPPTRPASTPPGSTSRRAWARRSAPAWPARGS